MKKTVVLTFDDGRRDQFENAARLMKQYRLPGTIFVTTAFLERPGESDWFPSACGRAMSI